MIRLGKAPFLVLALGVALLVAGCDDPNESAVPDGKDFRAAQVTLDGSDIVSTIEFYSTFDDGEFFYYINTGEHPYFLVKCRPGSFEVLKEEAGPPWGGFYDSLYTGTPTSSGNEYALEFPLGAIELLPNTEFNFRYWFFFMESGDRMPNSGEKVMAYVR